MYKQDPGETDVGVQSRFSSPISREKRHRKRAVRCGKKTVISMGGEDKKKWYHNTNHLLKTTVRGKRSPRRSSCSVAQILLVIVPAPTSAS
jgi:hypothetical protein